jgi:hypothetical protein
MPAGALAGAVEAQRSGGAANLGETWHPAGRVLHDLDWDSNQEVTYFLAWESLAERESKWTAFVSDPEWIAARNKSEEDGPIVANIASQLLAPTPFSSVK